MCMRLNIINIAVCLTWADEDEKVIKKGGEK